MKLVNDFICSDPQHSEDDCGLEYEYAHLPSGLCAKHLRAKMESLTDSLSREAYNSGRHVDGEILHLISMLLCSEHMIGALDFIDLPGLCPVSYEKKKEWVQTDNGDGFFN